MFHDATGPSLLLHLVKYVTGGVAFTEVKVASGYEQFSLVI